MNFLEFSKLFATEQDCIDYFIKIRYTKDMNCNHCSKDLENGFMQYAYFSINKPIKRRRGKNKNVVAQVLYRDKRKVKSEIMKKSLGGSKINSEQLLFVINKIIKDGTTIITDEF